MFKWKYRKISGIHVLNTKVLKSSNKFLNNLCLEKFMKITRVRYNNQLGAKNFTDKREDYENGAPSSGKQQFPESRERDRVEKFLGPGRSRENSLSPVCGSRSRAQYVSLCYPRISRHSHLSFLRPYTNISIPFLRA